VGHGGGEHDEDAAVDAAALFVAADEGAHADVADGAEGEDLDGGVQDGAAGGVVVGQFLAVPEDEAAAVADGGLLPDGGAGLGEVDDPLQGEAAHPAASDDPRDRFERDVGVQEISLRRVVQAVVRRPVRAGRPQPIRCRTALRGLAEHVHLHLLRGPDPWCFPRRVHLTQEIRQVTSGRESLRICGRGGGSGVFPATAVTKHNAPERQELRPGGCLSVA
jgi:hypothetical protein